MTTALYPGTFDPVTKGHLDVLARACRLFEKVIVAVSEGNNSKNTLFEASERVRLVEENLTEQNNVVVEAFSGLLVDYAAEKNASVLVRGLSDVAKSNSFFCHPWANWAEVPGTRNLW